MTRPEFRVLVEDAIGALRPGEVVTYGEIAAQIGRPGAARGVGAVLRTTGRALPWWRVVAADGRLAAPVAAEQARRLCGEGVEVEAGRVRRGPSGARGDEFGSRCPARGR